MSTVWLNVFSGRYFVVRLAAIFWKTLCLRRLSWFLCISRLVLPGRSDWDSVLICGRGYQPALSDCDVDCECGSEGGGDSRGDYRTGECSGRQAVHLHVQPCLESGSAGGASVAAGAEFGAAEEGVDEHSDSGAGDEDGEVCAGGAGGAGTRRRQAWWRLRMHCARG